MSYGRRRRLTGGGGAASPAVRICVVAALAAATVVPALAAGAQDKQSLSDIRKRMEAIQEDLDATTARLEDLRTEQERTRRRIAFSETRVQKLRKRTAGLVEKVVERADALYRSGGTQEIEALLESGSFSELTDRAEILSRASLDDSSVFVKMARARAELTATLDDLETDKAALARTTKELAAEADKLQERFKAARADYAELRSKLSRPSVSTPSTPSAPVRVGGGMACPVAGPHSFTDTWGAPRSGGRGHQGVDMMAAYGTPVVAITSGAITYAGYGGSAGYWQILSGDDGNQYWYLHNQQNIVTGGRVSTGQQIATVGDTGNARGTPHLHFEYHPGGGGAVNPTPLVASIC